MKRKLIKYILNILARLILWRYHPVVIGVAGSVGKTSTKEAIYTILKNNYRLGKNEFNLNTEIGLPLTIIQGKDAKRRIGLWFYNVFHALRLIIFKDKNYPSLLILEMSEDAPGVIKYLVNLARPQIGVVTAIGNPPVHLKYYKNIEGVIQEISYLPQHLPSGGTAILNVDYLPSPLMRNKITASVITYGFQDTADVQITNYKLIHEDNLNHLGCSFRLEYQGSYVPLRLEGVFGRAQAYALAAAAAVALSFKMNLVKIAELARDYKIIKGRTHFLSGINDSWILDDSYNACPDSVRNALDLIKEIPASRKIVFLGDMKELGYMANQAHREIGKEVGSIANIFVGVGEKMKLTQEIITNKYPAVETYWFSNSGEAAQKTRSLIKKGDLILVKGSRVMEMEKITQALRK